VFGRGLAMRIIRFQRSCPNANHIDPHFEDICAAALAILLEELHIYSDNDRSLHLEVVVATYVSLYQICGLDGEQRVQSKLSLIYHDFVGQTKLETDVSKACKVMSVPDFSHVVELITESLSNLEMTLESLSSLVRLLTILMHEAPESKPARCLGIISCRYLTLFSRHSETCPNVYNTVSQLICKPQLI
jgi:hypothetical protein